MSTSSYPLSSAGNSVGQLKAVSRASERASNNTTPHHPPNNKILCIKVPKKGRKEVGSNTYHHTHTKRHAGRFMPKIHGEGVTKYMHPKEKFSAHVSIHTELYSAINI